MTNLSLGKVLYQSALVFCMLIVLWTGWNAAFSLIGPQVEQRFIQPVKSFEVLRTKCDPETLAMEIFGVLNKTEYPGGTEAEFLGRVFYTAGQPRNTLPHRPVFERDQTSENRAPGLQTFEYTLEVRDCNERFYMVMYHRSPLTGNKLRTQWGPWSPSPWNSISTYK